MTVPLPTGEHDQPALLAELKRQIARLEAMFGDPGLAELRTAAPDHPAIERFDSLTTFLADSGQLTAANELEVSLDIGSAFIDHMTWPGELESGDFWSFIPDANARSYVERRIRVPEAYPDVVSELFWWGALSPKVGVAMGEEEGMPDLLLDTDPPSWGEVKCIHVGTSTNRVRKILQKANKQLKVADSDEVGAALVYIQRRGDRASLDDRIPGDVLPYIEAGRRVLDSGMCSAVAHVVFVWDEHLVLSEPSTTVYVVRRQSCSIAASDATAAVGGAIRCLEGRIYGGSLGKPRGRRHATPRPTVA